MVPVMPVLLLIFSICMTKRHTECATGNGTKVYSTFFLILINNFISMGRNGETMGRRNGRDVLI
jgi:hypothetical protein